jgi:hypothetical protein
LRQQSDACGGSHEERFAQHGQLLRKISHGVPIYSATPFPRLAMGRFRIEFLWLAIPFAGVEKLSVNQYRRE